MRGLGLILLVGCAGGGARTSVTDSTATVPTSNTTPSSTTEVPTTTEGAPAANVVGVRTTGDPGAYDFAVTLRSADTGCEQYADWWEVLGEDGQLRYRRILAHSHVDEQPFARSGGPVDASDSETLILRAHMSPGGYGGQTLQGSARAGFQPVTLQAGFGGGVETEDPQPSGCAF